MLTLLRTSRSWRNIVMVALLISLLALGFYGCKRRGKANLIFDEQWSVEQAENDCKSRLQDGLPPCSKQPATEIRNSELALSDAFRSDPECAGIALLTLNASTGTSYGSSDNTWWLFLELSRGLDDQKRWTVTQ